MYTPIRSPPLPELLFLMLEKRLADVHVSTSGQITRVDNVKGLVDVKPLLQGWLLNAANQRVPVSMPVVTGVPVVWPGGGGFRFTCPLAVGDTALLVFADRGLDRWKSLDGEVDPINFNSHALADAICIPGLRSFKNPLTYNPTDRATIGDDTTIARIEFMGAEIDIGTGADAAMVRGTDLVNFLTSWITGYNTHTHVFVGLPPGVTGATLLPTVLQGAVPASVLSTLTKVK